MRSRVALLLLSPLAFSAAPPDRASSLDCNTHTVGEAPYLCASTLSRAEAQGAEGGSSTNSVTGYFDQLGGPADTLATGAGGMSGVARLDVDWGTIRAYAESDNGSWTTAFGFPESRVISSAEGAFADIVTIQSSTLAQGAPVEITVTTPVEGSFSERGSDANLELTLSKPSNFAAFYTQRTGILFHDGGTPIVPFALQNYFVGDQIVFKLMIRADANTTDNVSPVIATSFADVEHTGHLVFEVNTPGVTLASMSGHDYTTAPEPGRASFVAMAALVLAGRALASSARGRA
jgi:hypothetical protein